MTTKTLILVIKPGINKNLLFNIAFTALAANRFAFIIILNRRANFRYLLFKEYKEVSTAPGHTTVTLTLCDFNS